MAYKSSLRNDNLDSYGTNSLGIPPSRATGVWNRNINWLPLPSVAATETKIVMLFGVFPTTSGITLTFGTSGTVTVTWGDGTSVSNSTTSQTLNKTYDYNSSALSGTNCPVTLTSTTNIVTRANHGYTNGDTVVFYDLATTTSIYNGRTYYVTNATTNTFQILTSPYSTTPVTFDVSGTAALLPYKQALITITATTITTFNCSSRPTFQPNSAYSYGEVPIMDMLISAPDLTTLTVISSGSIGLPSLERFQLISNNKVTSFSSLLSTVTGLRSATVVSGTFTSGGNIGLSLLTNTSSMFANCYALQVVSPPVMTAVTNAQQMFTSCNSLVSIPNLKTSSALTTTTSMFQQNYCLIVAPMMDTSGVTASASMLTSCPSLRQVPSYNLRKATALTSFLGSCYSLQQIPKLELGLDGAGVSVTQMFQNNYCLRTIPSLDVSKFTDASNMFNNCYSLVSVGTTPFNFTIVTSVSAMFSSCHSLWTLPKMTFATSSILNVSQMFQSCLSLRTMIDITIASSAVDTSQMFTSCLSLRMVKLSGGGVRSSSSTGSDFQSSVSLDTIVLSPSLRAFSGNGSAGTLYSGCTQLRSAPQLDWSGITALTASAFASCANYNGFGPTGPQYSFTAPLSAQNYSYAVRKARWIDGLGIAASTTTESTLSSINMAEAISGIGGSLRTNSNSKIIPMLSGTISSLTVGTALYGSLMTRQGPSNAWSSSAKVTGTITDGSPNITLSGYSYAMPDNNTKLGAWIVTGATNITRTSLYYLTAVDATTFTISSTPGGDPITITGTTGSTMTFYAEIVITAYTSTSITVNVAVSTGNAVITPLYTTSLPLFQTIGGKGWALNA